MIKLMNNHPHLFTIKKLHVCTGYCGVDSENEDVIAVDYRKELVPTLVHETLHYFYPNYCETKVYALERKICNNLTNQQIKKILLTLGGIM